MKPFQIGGTSPSAGDGAGSSLPRPHPAPSTRRSALTWPLLALTWIAYALGAVYGVCLWLGDWGLL